MIFNNIKYYYMDKINNISYFTDLINILKQNYTKVKFELIKSNNTFNFKSKFIPSNINDVISTHDSNFRIDLPHIKCNIWCKKLDSKLMKDIQLMLNRFYAIRSIFNKEDLNYNKQRFTLNYISTKCKKKLPTTKNKILGPNEINSGLSFIYENKIYIWRKEEFLKVFIHELFHCLGFDRFLIESKNQCNLTKYYNIQSNINCNEAYNEICALIYHCCFLKIKNAKLNIERLIQNNRLFTLLQIKKILNNYNINNLNNTTEFKQNTSVFSYFILKGIYLFYINDFVNIIRNGTYFLFPTENFYETFLNFNEIKMNDTKFTTIVNHICLNYKRPLSNSLRMYY